MSEIRVLIVEDEALLAMSIEDDLRDRGYTVTGVAATVARAVALARRTRPHVVLMDVRLKGEGDGIDAARRIHDQGLGAKVIFLTGSREPATLARIEQDHAAVLLIKPAGPDQIDEAIRSVL